MQPHDAVSVNPFAASRARFEALIGSLGSDSALAKDHAELERTLKQDGFELLRQLFQDHVDLRGIREEALPGLLGGDEVLRTHRRDSERTLETIFGTVVVRHLAYGTAGHRSLHPMDAVLNLPRESFSLGVRRHVAEAVAHGAYDGAVENVLGYTGAHLAKRQAEVLARKAAADFDTFYTRRAATVPMGSRESILVITVDGKGIVMRPEDLRESTKKAAAKGKRKLKHRLTSGEKANRKRMATVAAVYAIGVFRRTASDIMDVGGAQKARESGDPRAFPVSSPAVYAFAPGSVLGGRPGGRRLRFVERS